MTPRTTTSTRLLCLLLLVAVVAFAVAGCSKGGSKKSGGTTSGNSTSSSPGPSQSSGTPPPSVFGVVHRYASTSSLKGNGKKTLAVVDACGTCGGDSRMNTALKKVTGELGWKLLVVDANGDQSKGIADFNTMIQRKVDGIISASWDPYTLSGVIKKANTAHIPFVVTAGDWVPGAAFACCMDSPQMGQMEAAWVYQRLFSKGDIVMFDVPGARDVAERKATFTSLIKLFPNMKIVEDQQINFQDPTGGARRTMSSLLLKYHGKIAAVWAPWDDPAIGASEAIDASQYRGKVFVVGNDGGPDARARICGNSSFDGTVYVAYEDWAKVLVQEFGQIFQGKGPSGRWLYTPQFIISRRLNNCPSGKQLPPSAGYYYSYWTR
jgi:ribose transport system substrate-binding protein